MSSNTKVKGTKLEELVSKMDGGLAELDPSARFMAEGQLVDAPTLRTWLKDANAPFAQVNASRNQVAKDMAAKKEAAPASKKKVKAVANAVVAYCNGDPTLLDKFGLPAPKAPRQLTAEEKLVRSAKAKATREGRHTLGSRQKAKIKATGEFKVSVSQTQGNDGSSSTSDPPPGNTVNGAAH